MRRHLLLAALLFVFPTICWAGPKRTKSCVMNDDGTCLSDDLQDDEELECFDSEERCEGWAKLGECDKNPIYMLQKCAKSCKVCGQNPADLAMQEQQKVEEASSSDAVETQWGEVQEVAGNHAAKTKEVIEKTKDYMLNKVLVDPAFDKVRKECKNRSKNCAFWSAIGECEVNPAYMTLQCAPSCQTCDKIDFEARCPYDPNAPTIMNPGDINRMFERIVNDPLYAQYEPVIYSMPNPTKEGIKDGPWLVTLENFTTSEECERLIELGGKQGYEVSKDVGKQNFDGSYDGYQNDGRTSTNAWCTEACYNDTLTQSVLARIENTTGVPDSHSEYLQLLKYEPGQYYRTHHDYIEHHVNRAEGVRILTVFLYLNDVEAGGGTDFPRLGITVQPKRGRAVIWASVLDEDPNAKDARTHHQALPVEKGVKYGANAWLHQRDFKLPYSKSCH